MQDHLSAAFYVHCPEPVNVAVIGAGFPDTPTCSPDPQAQSERKLRRPVEAHNTGVAIGKRPAPRFLLFLIGPD